MVNRLVLQLERSISSIRSSESYRRVISTVFCRYLVQKSEAGVEENRENMEIKPELASKLPDSKWKPELQWISKALEPALQLYNWASETEKDDKRKLPSNSRSLAEILSNLQRSKAGIQDWSFSDVTLGLYLIYLRQSSTQKSETVKGTQVFSDKLVEDLIYNVELAKGAYKENASGLAKHSMLREKNIIKFVKDSSVMRPGYYIGIDERNELVVLGIRGTHTVYDLITDLISSSDQRVALEGFSTHFGTAEAARWFLRHELSTIKKYLNKHKGYKLRVVGHSLGGAAAALLAINLRRISAEELGFDPNLISAVGFGTPPCVSKGLAESCSTFVSTVVLQDDVIPRLSTASLARLRNDILQTDWRDVTGGRDWKSVVEWVGNARQVVSLVQDVARNLSDYATFGKTSAEFPGITTKVESSRVETSTLIPEELFVPGTMFYLKRTVGAGGDSCYSLWQREPGEHFQRIILSGNLISDHKCDSHYLALRDVLKGLHKSHH
ncbi:alpha/beta-Hydrolases superfamily protein [Wolffia australiana]